MEVSIPQYLSRPMLVLWWESDELVVGMIFFILAFSIGGLAPVGLAILIFTIYRRAKKNMGRGFLNHLPYILGFKNFYGFPHTYVDKFEE